MTPGFEIEGGLALALTRAASVAGLVGAGGTLVYARLLRPADLGLPATRGLRRLGLACLLAAWLGGLAWLLAQTLDLVGSLWPADVWSVLSSTMFGRLVAARLALLTVAALALALRAGLAAALLAGAALVLQAGHSHALAMGGSRLLLASAGLHLLAAGVWLGGLPGLLLVLRGASPGLALDAARRFSRAGVACVAVLLATATVQFGILVAGLPGLVGTAYGWMVGAKMVLFAGLVALAARNRLVLSPALRRAHGLQAVGALRASILLEIALGLAVLAAAGVLTELPPAMHAQPDWPFGWLPSLEAAREDPDILREVTLAGAMAAAGLLFVLGGAALARRRRWPGLTACLAGLVMLAAAAPHAAPLLVPAVPTVFYRSPTGFSTAAVLAGQALYGPHCAACHGAQGRGDGAAGRALAVPPANLTQAHLWMHSDGELFWWLTHGMLAPDGRPAMPGFPLLPADERWDLIDYVRGHNAGLTLAGGRWGTQVQAPDFAIDCGGRALRLSTLRGRPVRVVLTGPVAPETVATVVVPPATGADGCTVADESVPRAYAVVAPGAAAVLVDANGWLRRAAATAAGLDAGLPSVQAAPLPSARPAMDMNTEMDMPMGTSGDTMTASGAKEQARGGIAPGPH